MANKVIVKIKDAAERLYEVRQEIEAKEDEVKKELESLKLERDTLQALLVSDLKKQGLLSIKVSSGDSFILGTRKGVDITNEALAFKWAYSQKAVSIDKRIVAQVMKDMKDIPPGFEIVNSEFISVRKAKEKEDAK